MKEIYTIEIAPNKTVGRYELLHSAIERAYKESLLTEYKITIICKISGLRLDMHGRSESTYSVILYEDALSHDFNSYIEAYTCFIDNVNARWLIKNHDQVEVLESRGNRA